MINFQAIILTSSSQTGQLSTQENQINNTLFFNLISVPIFVTFNFSESDSVSWEIEKVTLKDEGHYECIAISSAGTGRARTFLDVSGKLTSQDSQ